MLVTKEIITVEYLKIRHSENVLKNISRIQVRKQVRLLQNPNPEDIDVLRVLLADEAFALKSYLFRPFVY